MTLAIPRLDRTTAEEHGLTIADFLVPIRVGERVNARVRDVALVVAGALLVYLTARIVIPVPGFAGADHRARRSASCSSVARSGFRRGLIARRAVRAARRRRPAVLRRGQGRALGHLGCDRRLSRRLRRRRRRSSVGWPSSAGIGGSAARSARCCSAAS